MSEDHMGAAMDGGRGRRAPLSIRSILLLFALIPLVGGVAFGVTEVRESQTERRLAAELAAQVDELIEVTELRAALISERDLASAAAAVTQLGFDPGLVQQFSGIDLAG
ncbi:MAG: hypothetical protein AAGG08_05750, partial [Actinomycetota bacterium]